MIAPENLEAKISELLSDFYKRRIEKISGLKLKDTLKRKNPYLYRAVGIQKASQIVEEILIAYMSSSDEGIFGDAFFEPLAKFASGGVVSPSPGVDVAIETDSKYTAIAVKSGTSVFNSQSKAKQILEFQHLQRRLQKLQKQFDPIIGFSYGNKQQRIQSTAFYRELAGQAFWAEITGDEDFYLKIIQLMKNKPSEHLPEYRMAFDSALNRFTKEFIDDFCFENGIINWEKLVKFNSGRPEVKAPTKKIKKT